MATPLLFHASAVSRTYQNLRRQAKTLKALMPRDHALYEDAREQLQGLLDEIDGLIECSTGLADHLNPTGLGRNQLRPYRHSA